MAESKTKIVGKTIGRRREAVASVRLTSGETTMTVNDKPIATYFPGLTSKLRYDLPMKVTGVVDKYGASIKVHGGGIKGQLDATVLGIARALADLKNDFHKQLRDAGLLTRDPRKRERRKVGTGGKARRRKQSPKR